MEPLSLITGGLIFVYGMLNALAGLMQLKSKEIQRWSAWLMLGFGALIIYSGVTMAMHTSFSLYALVFGLIAIHLLTLNNGYHLHSRINPGHHFLRFFIFFVLIVLALMSLQ